MAEAEKREQWQEWMDEFQGESDRACAVLGAAFLDEHLRALLEAFFVDDRKRAAALLQGGSAPLATLASRAALAYALGLLSPSEIHDLQLIRSIRNAFAHQLHGLSFASMRINRWCAQLTRCELGRPFQGDLGLRDRFVLSVVILANCIALRRLGVGSARRTVHAEIGVVSHDARSPA